MTLYETLKFIHIVAAAIVLGGSLMVVALLVSALVGKNGEKLAAFSTLASWVGNRVFAPAWALVLGFGIWTTLEGNLEFGDAWISIGFVVFAIAFILGPTVHERNARALRVAIEGAGPASAQALAIGRREAMVGVVEVALIILAVWAMTAKPGL